MGVRAIVSPLASVIVNNFNARWTGLILGPLKTNAPLVVDPNGILPLAVSLQGFQTVGVGAQQDHLTRLPSRECVNASRPGAGTAPTSGSFRQPRDAPCPCRDKS